MAEKKSKKSGFFGRFMKVLSGAPDTKSTELDTEKGKYAPQEVEPNDVRFARNFTEAGGFFMYCGTVPELNSAIKDIMASHNLLGLGSPDNNLLSFLKKQQIPHLQNNVKDADTICTYCEAMIAFNGGIMINEYQTKGLKIDQMPKYHIVLGRTSQLVENLSSAMSKMNQQYRNERPMQISQLKAPLDHQVKLANADPNKGRTLFLLLLEDTF